MLISGLLCVLVTSAWGQGADNPYEVKRTVELEAAPAERLIPALGKAYGVTLRAEGQTRNDVLVISVKDVTLKELMARIAKVDSASWEKDKEGVYQLIRTEEQKQKQIKADRQREAAQIQKQRDEYAKHWTKDKKLSIDEAKTLIDRYTKLNQEFQELIKEGYTDAVQENSTATQAIRAQMPLERMFHRIEMSLDPLFLASLPEYKPVDLSDKPNTVQYQLPLRMSPIYQEFLEAHQTFFEASGRKVDSNYPEFLGYQCYGSRIYRDLPLKVIVSLTKYHELGVRMTLYVVNQDHQIEYVQQPFNLPIALVDKMDKTPGPPFIESLSGDSKKLIQEIMRIGSPTKQPQTRDIDTRVKDLYLDPVENEPLEYLFGAILKANSRQSNSNLVAVLTDNVRGFIALLPYQETTTLTNIVKLLESVCNLEHDSTPGWIEVQPKYPSKAWEQRIDRHTLKALFKACDFTTPNLDMSAGFALKMPFSFDEGLPVILTYFSQSGSKLLREMRQGYFGLRFYGTLTKRQRMDLENGAVLKFNTLSPQQRQALYDAVYSGPIQLSLVPTTDGGPLNQRVGFLAGLRSEQLGEGIPSESQISLVASNSERALPYLKDHYYSDALDANRLGWQLATFEHYQNLGDVPTNSIRFRYMVHKQLKFRFTFLPDVYGTMTLVDGEKDAGGRLLKFSELPLEFRDIAMKQYEVAKKQYGGNQTTSGNGTIKP